MVKVMKTKILALLTLFIGCVSLFVGCSNPYKNMKIHLSETEIKIELENKQEDIQPKVVTASVSGVGENVSKNLIVTTQSSCISLSTVVNEKGETEISILPILSATEKSAVITVASQEGGKSANISVSISIKPTEMFLNEGYKPAVSVNGKLQLNGDLAVNYGEGGDNITEKDVKFSLVDEYENIELTPSGLLSVGNKKPTTENGAIRVKVENIATSLTPKNQQGEEQFLEVRVIEAIKSLDEISIKLDNQDVQEQLIIRLNDNAKPVLTFETATTENYEFNVVSQNSTIVNVLKLNEKSFELSGLVAKETVLSVSCFVSGYETYSPFNFELPIKNVFVPTDILINNSNQTGQELSLFTSYVNGVLGTAVKLNVYPNGVEEENSYIKISSSHPDFSKITWLFSDETEITDLQNIPSGVTIYAFVNGEINGLDGMEIVFESTNFENISNNMIVKTYQGIANAEIENLTEISTATDKTENVLMIEKGKSCTLNLVLTDANEYVINLENTDLVAKVLNGSEIVDIEKTTITDGSNNKEVFVLTGLEVGEVNIELSSLNSFNIVFKAKVVVAIDETQISLSLPTINENSGVAYLEYNAENKTAKYKIFQNKSIDVAFVKNNNATVIEKFSVQANNNCCSVSSNGTITTGSYAKGNSAIISATIIGWKFEQSVCTEFKTTYIINVTIVEGISNVNIVVDGGFSDTIYMADSVGALYPNLSKTSLSATLNESIFNSLSLENEDKVEVNWQINDVEIEWAEDVDYLNIKWLQNIKATKNDNKLTLSFASLDAYDEGSGFLGVNSINFTVNLSFSQYGRQVKFFKEIKLVRATIIGNVNILNLEEYNGNKKIASLKYQKYFDARNGLNSENNTFTINAQVTPLNAFNKKLRYFSSNPNIATVDEFSGKITPISAGECYVYVAREDSVTSVIKENDVLKVEIENGGNPENAPKAEITTIQIYVADGTKENPFEIKTAEELLEVNQSAENLSYFYVLNAHINLNNINFAPIGSLKDETGIEIGFSGGLYGGRDGLNFAISNLTIIESNLNAEKYALQNLGFVSTLKNGAKLERINLVNFKIQSSTAQNIGGLAGLNLGEITGTYVHWNNNSSTENEGTEILTSFNFENFDLIGIISASENSSVGAVSGTNNGKIESVSVHCVNEDGVALTGGVVGGIAGYNSKSISNCFVNANINGTTVGGIVGINLQDLGTTIEKCYVEAYKSNETISGTTVGGIAGDNYGLISLSYVRSFVIDNLLTGVSRCGAFAGTNSGTISQTYALLGSNISAVAQNSGTLQDYFVNSDFHKDNSDNWEANELKNNPVEKIPEGLELKLNTIENFVNHENLNSTFIAYLKTPIIEIEKISETLNLYALNELLTVTPNPSVKHLQLVAQSDNPSAVSIVIDGGVAKFKLNGEGKATITLTALKNKNVNCSFDIFVVNGVNNINYVSSAFNENKDVLTIEKYQTVKINANATFDNFDVNKNISYELSLSGSDLSLSESELATYGLTFNPSTLTFTAIKECSVKVTLKPYIQISANIKHYLSNTITFTIKCTERANLISVNKTSESIYPIDETEFVVTLLTTKDIVSNSNAEKLEHQLTGKSDILSVNIQQGEINTTEINGNTYYQTTYTFLIKIHNNKKATISQNEQFEFKFWTHLWENEENITVFATYNLTVIPQKLINISAQHFPLGVGPYRQGNSDKPVEPEPSSDIIIPGNVGILQLDLYPTYAKMENIYISSSSAGGDRLTFEQVKYVADSNNTGFYKIEKVYPLPIYQPDGSIALNVEENVSIYYLKTYISSDIAENTTFTITVRGKGSANSEDIIRAFDFTVKNSATTTITPTKNNAYVNELSGNSVFVAGMDAEINFNQIRFNNENIDVKVYDKQESATDDFTVERKADEKGNFISMVSGNTTTYPYLIKPNVNPNELYGKTYIIKFTVVANINGLTETIETKKSIVFVKEKLVNFAIEPCETDEFNGFGDVPYNGQRDYLISATYYSAENKNGKTINSKDYNKIRGLISSKYLTLENQIPDTNENGIIRMFFNTQGTFSVQGYSTNSSKIFLNSAYSYNENGEFVISESENNKIECNIAINVNVYSSDDNPYPIYTSAEFIKKLNEETENPLDYILMNNIVLENYTPINFNAKSVDGNGRVVTIKNFDASSFYESGFANESIALGLFNKVSENSIIKNVVLTVESTKLVNNLQDVNEDESTNLTMFNNVNVGLFAVINNGIINNCSVGNYEGYDKNLNGSYKAYSEKENQLTYTFLTANSSVSKSNFSLFVGTNNGYISNSRVNGINNGDLSKHKTYSKEQIHLQANGNLAGFVGINNGAISASYAKAIKLENTSSFIAETKTSGFVVSNNNGARIMYSYAEGFGENFVISTPGNALISKGTGAGFVYENTGLIKECSANISVENILSQSGGFVYNNKNSGEIINCVSSSKITPNSTKNSLFSAINTLNQSLNEGSISYCYAYEQENNLSVVTDVESGVALIDNHNFHNSTPYSFAINNETANWNVYQDFGPVPVVAEQNISRIREVVSSNNKATSSLNEFSYNEVGGQWNGSAKTKPYLIYSAESYNDFIKLTTGYSSYHAILVCDISFEASEITSQKLNYKGTFNGNGFNISNVSLVTNEASANAPHSFGFFGSTMEYKVETEKQTVIKNANFNVVEVTATKSYFVGTVAGKMKNTHLFDISINGETETAVTGRNWVGGIAGYVENVNAFNCVNNGVSVGSEFAHGSITEVWKSENENKFSMEDVYKDNMFYDANYKFNGDENFVNYSYAGGLFGVVNDIDNSLTTDINESSVLNKLTTENKVIIKGENAGGIAGYLSKNSTINNAEFIAVWNQQSTDFSQGIYGTRNAGAIVAHSAGSIGYVRLDCSQENKELADSTTAQLTSENTHISNLFAKTNYRTGGLVGYMIDGTISNSYSRIDVRNRNAHIAGGLVGEAKNGSIIKCYATSSVFAYLNYTEGKTEIFARIGGLVGLKSSTVGISACVALNKWKSETVSAISSNFVMGNELWTTSDWNSANYSEQKITAPNSVYGVKINSFGQTNNTYTFQQYIENSKVEMVIDKEVVSVNLRDYVFSKFSLNWNKSGLFPTLIIYNHNTY